MKAGGLETDRSLVKKDHDSRKRRSLDHDNNLSER